MLGPAEEAAGRQAVHELARTEPSRARKGEAMASEGDYSMRLMMLNIGM